MKKLIAAGIAVLATCAAPLAVAADARTSAPAVTLSASATANVANDRMYTWLRAEVDNADPARAAAEVNTRMGKALAQARAVAGVDVATSGYSSYQVSEKNQPTRWRVAQTLTLEGQDFAALAALVTRLQADDGLVLSGMNFAVSPAARRKAEDALTGEAIKAWQARADNAARGFGFDAWKMGNVTIQTGDFMRPQPMMRMQAGAMASAPPVSVEGGNTDVTVTVSGEALLEGPRPAR